MSYHIGFICKVEGAAMSGEKVREASKIEGGGLKKRHHGDRSRYIGIYGA